MVAESGWGVRGIDMQRQSRLHFWFGVRCAPNSTRNSAFFMLPGMTTLAMRLMEFLFGGMGGASSKAGCLEY